MKKSAIIIGGTGLVGKNILNQLLSDEEFSTIKIFVRRKTGIQNSKLREHVIDFDNIEKIAHEINGDVLFSCLGTTLKQAGSKKEQYKVDYTYQYEFAKYASINGIPDYFLVSAPSANKNSLIFYNRIKGELENAIKDLKFNRIRIFQPSVLTGQRNHKRKNEELGAQIIDSLSNTLTFLKKYRSISGSQVAQSMRYHYNQKETEQIKVIKLDEIFRS